MRQLYTKRIINNSFTIVSQNYDNKARQRDCNYSNVAYRIRISEVGEQVCLVIGRVIY